MAALTLDRVATSRAAATTEYAEFVDDS